MRRFLILMLSVIGLFAFSTTVFAQESNNVIDEDGYYYVYTISGTSERGMTVINGRFCWDPLVRANPQFIFRLESNGTENQYYMYNLREDSWYWAVTGYYFAEFKQGIENRTAMLFDPQDDGKTSFKIRPVKLRGDYEGNESGYIEHGNFSLGSTRDFPGKDSYYHSLGQWTGSIWYVEKVSTAELNAAKMLVDLRKATQVYSDNALYTLNDSPLITDVPADCDPLTGQPGQFFSTCQRQDDTSSSFANLIDGTIDDNKRFQSTWDNTTPMPQFLQVDVSADNTEKTVGGVQLQIGLRPNGWGSTEFPTDITIYATNDESVAEDMELTTIEDVAEKNSWVKIGDYDLSTSQVLTSENGSWGQLRSAVVTNSELVQNRWETKNIVFPNNQKYRWIRFYVNNTAVPASDNHEFTFCEFQLRELENPTTTGAQADAMQTLRTLIAEGNTKVKAQTVTDEDITALEAAIEAVNNSKSKTLSQLLAIVDSVKSLNLTFTPGSEPGYNDSTAVADFNVALAAAEAGTHASLSDEEYTQLGVNLLAALETAKNSILPVTDGYYNIVSCHSGFFTTMAMTGLPTQNILGWQMYDINNPAQLFKVTTTGEGQFSIQNVQTGKYIGTIPGTSQEVIVTDTPVTPQTFTNINGYAGQLNIANTENAMAYHTEFHQNGENAKGYVCTWDGGANTGSAWRLVPVTGAKRDSLIAVAPQANRQAIAAHEVDTARAAYDKTFNYKQSEYLITNCDETDPDNCQWWSNSQEPSAGDYSSFANLIDGNLNTCFQSTWDAYTHEKPQWIQADLKDHPVKDFSLYYGLRNNTAGAWLQWTQIAVFATNDVSVAKDESIDTYEQISASDSWKKIGVFDLPDEQAIRNYAGSDRSFVYDINNIMDQKYRFIRFYATHVYRPFPPDSHDVGSFSMGELNIMENTYDEASAPYYYVNGLKDAADQLKAQENAVTEALAAGNVTQEQIDRLIELRKAVVALTPHKDNLQVLYNTANAYVSKFAAGEEYGDVTDAEWTAIQTALQNAKAVLDASQPSQPDIDAQETALTEAYNVFQVAQKQIEPYKWYYITSLCTTRNGSIQVNGEGETAGISHQNNIYSTFCYGNCAYASTDNTGSGWGPSSSNEALKWGYYVWGIEKGGTGGSELYSDLLDPHTMWRLVPIEGKDGQYAIQNRANGHFMTNYAGSSWIGLTNDTVPYVFELLGSGAYRFRTAVSSIYMQFAGDGFLYSYNADIDNPEGETSFTLEPVETPENVVMEYPYNNNIFIKSVPYAIDAATLAMNDNDVVIYGVKGLEVVGSDSTLLLEKKTSVAAGEPFIVITGDYTAFNSENPTTTALVLPAVDEFSFEGKTVNGLTAALDYTIAPKAGLGYFVNAVLATTETGIGIVGHTGYFDVKNMPLFTTTTEADKRIPLNGTGVDAIKSITTAGDGVVNVYSIDGKLVKKNVVGSKAVKGLGKGIYIVGKKKVTVK